MHDYPHGDTTECRSQINVEESAGLGGLLEVSNRRNWSEAETMKEERADGGARERARHTPSTAEEMAWGLAGKRGCGRGSTEMHTRAARGSSGDWGCPRCRRAFA